MTPQRFLAWFPRGVKLTDEEFERRHSTLTALLLLQVPALFAVGLLTGLEMAQIGLELAFPLVAGIVGWSKGVRRRLRSFAVTAGLVYLSAVVVQLADGAVQSHFHFFVMISFIALYQDWAPFGWAVGFTMGSNVVLTWLGVNVFGDTAGADDPLLYSAIHAAAVLAASIGQLLTWKAAERQESAVLEAEASAREQQELANRRDAFSRLYVNLARRSQSLIDRQMTTIDQLESQVEDADVLAHVFELDHLTTRVRRHGESLLVVAGAELAARHREPVALLDIARGAQSEVEQYKRVNVSVHGGVTVDGPVVRDLVHLLAELIENATVFSSPATSVDVNVLGTRDGGVVMTVVDRGLGVEPHRLERINEDLLDPRHLDEESGRHLGLQVVARLAAKHGIGVQLAHTEGGGTTAWVQVPGSVITGGMDQLSPAVDVPRIEAPAPEADADVAPPALDAAAPEVAAAAPAAPPVPDESPAPAPDPEPAAPGVPPVVSPLSGGGRGKGRAPSRRRRGGKKRSSGHSGLGGPIPGAPSAPPSPAGSTAPAASPAPAPAPAPPGPAPALPSRKPKPAATQTPPPPQPEPATVPTGAPPPPVGAAAEAPAATEGVPALPKRRPGAAQRALPTESVDLFGDLDSVSAARASLSEFQRGQRAARSDNNEDT